jgi:hypothetical protein
MLVPDTLLAAVVETDLRNVFALALGLGLAVGSTLDRLFGCLCDSVCRRHLCSLYSISLMSLDGQGRSAEELIV